MIASKPTHRTFTINPRVRACVAKSDEGIPHRIRKMLWVLIPSRVLPRQEATLDEISSSTGTFAIALHRMWIVRQYSQDDRWSRAGGDEVEEGRFGYRFVSKILLFSNRLRDARPRIYDSALFSAPHGKIRRSKSLPRVVGGRLPTL